MAVAALNKLDSHYWTARICSEVLVRGVVLAVGLAMVVFGWENFLSGFNSFRMPSMLPIAYLYWPIPVCGALIALFSLEQIMNGLKNGFERDRVINTEALEAIP